MAIVEISGVAFQHIHKDARGEINCFYVNGVEYTILTTRELSARGGCIHNKNIEYFVVLKGEVEYYFIYPSEEVVRRYHIGESGLVPANIPHYFVALEDSVTLEWGATPKEKKEYHKPTRKIVDDINWVTEICPCDR